MQSFSWNPPEDRGGGDVSVNVMECIERLVLVGQQAGISVQQMIDLLNAGLSVEGLLLLIELRLREPKPVTQSKMPNWKM